MTGRDEDDRGGRMRQQVAGQRSGWGGISSQVPGLGSRDWEWGGGRGWGRRLGGATALRIRTQRPERASNADVAMECGLVSLGLHYFLRMAHALYCRSRRCLASVALYKACPCNTLDTTQLINGNVNGSVNGNTKSGAIHMHFISETSRDQRRNCQNSVVMHSLTVLNQASSQLSYQPTPAV